MLFLCLEFICCMLNKLFIFIFAEPTVNSKSFREKLYGFFTYIIKWLFVKPKDVVYEHPEISIEFKPNTVGFFSYFSGIIYY